MALLISNVDEMIDDGVRPRYFKHDQLTGDAETIVGDFRKFEGDGGVQVPYWRANRQTPSDTVVVLLRSPGMDAAARTALTESFVAQGHEFLVTDLRGFGASSSLACESVSSIARDLDRFVRDLAGRPGHDMARIFVVANGEAAVVAAAWMHDFAPMVRGVALVDPAFGKAGVLPSLTKRKNEPARTAMADEVSKVASRVIEDARAIVTPTFVFTSRHPAEAARQHLFFERLGSKDKRRLPLTPNGAAAYRLDHVSEEAGAFFSSLPPIDRRDLLEAHRYGYTKDEADILSTPITPASVNDAKWRILRAGIGLGSRLSSGLRLASSTGFTSGSTLDHLHRNEPRGMGALGRAVDRRFVESAGGRALRQRRDHLVEMVDDAIWDLFGSERDTHILDVSAESPTWLMEVWKQLSVTPDSMAVWRVGGEIVTKGENYALLRALDDLVSVEAEDVFEASQVSLKTKPDLVVAAGTFEAVCDNGKVSDALSWIGRAMNPGGYLVYTSMPWHPNWEVMARSVGGQALRRRTQAEIDALVEAARFEKIDQKMDRWGIYGVSVARKL